MKELQDLRGLQERLLVDTSEDCPVYLLAIGNPPIYIRLSPVAYQLLQQRSLGVSFESLAQTISQQTGKCMSPANVEIAYQQVVERISEIERNPKRQRSGFLIRLPLLPKETVNQIACYLSLAFQPKIALCLLAGVVAATAIAPQHDLTLNVTPTGLWWGYALFIVSLLIHELGHASACVRYGAEPSDIGFTIYLIWPGFYSNVSAAWKLKRWQRVIVDLGGIFFQLIVAAIYVVTYTFTNWAPLKVALVMIVGSCLFSLNPIFKFDGYWVLADALGVTNLSQEPRRIFRHIFDRLNQRSVKPLPWSPLIMSVLALYTVFSFGIWGYFFWVVLPTLWRHVLSYPEVIISLIDSCLNPPHLPELKQLQSFIASSFMVTIVLLILWRLTILVSVFLIKRLRRFIVLS